ncbi:MAG: 3-phosphoshikimate 1-carboxyvinyltransferase [Francisellaceae bacterium]
MCDTLPLVTQPVAAKINLPGSKSIANRVLLIAAVAKGVSVIENVPANKDVQACIDVLKALGVKHDYKPHQCQITIYGNSGVFAVDHARIYCHEAGTLTRFIIPMCATQQQGEYYIFAADRMMERPMADQLDVLVTLGMCYESLNKPKSLPLMLHAQGLENKEVEISGQKSSQFLSGLLLAAPLISGGIDIHSQVDHMEPYVKITTEVMAEFGVDVDVDGHRYRVKPDQSYVARDYVIEPDVSTASYFWALAALSDGSVKVNNVGLSAKQGDIRFLQVLKQMGCDVRDDHDGICVTGSGSLKGVRVNMRGFSDTFMTVCALAVFAEGETHLTGLAHTRLQESDRIEAMAEGLKTLGINVETHDDGISVYPQKSSLRPGSVSSHNDHRIAMSLALIGVKLPGVIIEGAESVAKTCPDYFERMRAMIQ